MSDYNASTSQPYHNPYENPIVKASYLLFITLFLGSLFIREFVDLYVTNPEPNTYIDLMFLFLLIVPVVVVRVLYWFSDLVLKFRGVGEGNIDFILKWLIKQCQGEKCVFSVWGYELDQLYEYDVECVRFNDRDVMVRYVEVEYKGNEYFIQCVDNPYVKRVLTVCITPLD